eukprot:scaffold2384_cov120-Isochrysis_galbana.AAC.2
MVALASAVRHTMSGFMPSATARCHTRTAAPAISSRSCSEYRRGELRAMAVRQLARARCCLFSGMRCHRLRRIGAGPSGALSGSSPSATGSWPNPCSVSALTASAASPASAAAARIACRPSGSIPPPAPGTRMASATSDVASRATITSAACTTAIHSAVSKWVSAARKDAHEPGAASAGRVDSAYSSTASRASPALPSAVMARLSALACRTGLERRPRRCAARKARSSSLAPADSQARASCASRDGKMHGPPPASARSTRACASADAETRLENRIMASGLSGRAAAAIASRARPRGEPSLATFCSARSHTVAA